MREAVHRALHRAGFDLVRYDGRRFAARRRIEEIRRADVTVVLDVGAGSGQFVRRLRDEGYDGRIVAFEPGDEAFARLERRAAADGALSCLNVALGDRDGETVLNRAGNLWSSSLLPMTDRHRAAAPESAYVGEQRVRVARLDGLGVVAAQDRAYLKVDVQGAEGAVLEGAAGVLDRIVAVEAELSFVELYEGQELFPTLHAGLCARGFALVFLDAAGLRDPASDEIFAVDGIFVRAAGGPGAAGAR